MPNQDNQQKRLNLILDEPVEPKPEPEPKEFGPPLNPPNLNWAETAQQLIQLTNVREGIYDLRPTLQNFWEEMAEAVDKETVERLQQFNQLNREKGLPLITLSQLWRRSGARITARAMGNMSEEMIQEYFGDPKS